MIKSTLRAGLLAAALMTAGAAPAFAQDPAASAGPGYHGGKYGGMRGMRQAFAKLSPEGRATLMGAMQSLKNDGTRDQIKAARGRMLDLLAADRLDVVALRRAMAEERNLAEAQRERMQEAMLGAYQRLSVEDRRAFVAGAREARQWMEQRRAQRRAQTPAQN